MSRQPATAPPIRRWWPFAAAGALAAALVLVSLLADTACIGSCTESGSASPLTILAALGVVVGLASGAVRQPRAGTAVLLAAATLALVATLTD